MQIQIKQENINSTKLDVKTANNWMEVPNKKDITQEKTKEKNKSSNGTQ